MSLWEAREGTEYTVKSVAVNDKEWETFLFSLGCYSGEPISVVTRLKSGCIVSIKNGRYMIDSRLARAIGV